MTPMIELNQVSYAYPGISDPALRGINLAVPEGQFLAVVGANGAGKSTLASLIAGFIPHFYHGVLQGDVRVNGKKTMETPLSELVLLVGMVFQNPFNQISGTKFTVREEIAFGLENLGLPREEMEPRIHSAMDAAGITGLAERSPMALSGGQMQRVAIASVLAMHPRILVLDEPTSQLDPIGSREVFTAVRELTASHRMTVIMIEHKLEWLAVYADRMIALSAGEIIADGSPTEVLTDYRLTTAGVGQTRFTQAARRAQSLGRWPENRPLAVTLDEAQAGFHELKGAPGP
jgi:energy-coupling factor transport system ATP-binding protein